MSRRCIRGLLVAALVGSGASRAQAQERAVIGRFHECYDRQRVLVNAGYETADNEQHHGGMTGRLMITTQCYSRGMDGIEYGILTVPYHEETRAGSSSTLWGSGNRTQYFGFVTEQFIPGFVENFRLVGGVGFYASATRWMNQYSSTYNGVTQTSRNDYTSTNTGVGLSIGAAFVLTPATSAVHLDVRQHYSGVGGGRLTLSAGILF